MNMISDEVEETIQQVDELDLNPADLE